MRALKRLKEQLKNWRETCGCGFDPSLLSDVAREVCVGERFPLVFDIVSSPRFRY